MSTAVSSLFPVRIERKTIEAEGIVGFELVSLDGSPLPAFDAGAHVDVQAPGGVLRQYSLCSPPGETARYEIGVLRDPASRGGSTAMHDGTHVGGTLQISAPKNHFPLDEKAQHSLLFAGGIGVTPLIAMAERLSTLGASFEMHYCTRSPARTAYAHRLGTRPYADKVHIHHDDGPAEQKLDLAAKLRTPQPGTHLYVCGPSGFLDAVRATARDAGWHDDQVHFEYFAGGSAHSAEDRSFDIVIKSSGKVIHVEAAQTVTEVLEANGVSVPVSCQQGVCGTCLVNVLEGECDHKDLYLTSDEQASNKQFLPCVSRSKGPRLVLDL